MCCPSFPHASTSHSSLTKMDGIGPARPEAQSGPARFHLAAPFCKRPGDRKTCQMFHIKGSPSREKSLGAQGSCVCVCVESVGERGVVRGLRLWDSAGTQVGARLGWVTVSVNKDGKEGNFRRRKVSISAKVLPARCAGMKRWAGSRPVRLPC